MKTKLPILLPLLLVSSLFAQTQPTTQPTTQPENPDPAHYMFESDIKLGSKGYGLTIMHGGKIEKFEFEVIDVLKNFSPGNNAILVKCSGLNLENSGIIAGMSGSPCYIDGKMIGAIAYGWPLAKEPIGGIQPIRQMLNIPVDTKTPPPARSSIWSDNPAYVKAAAASPYSPLIKNITKRLPASPKPALPLNPDKRAASLKPLATPLMLGGASPRTRAFLESAFAHSQFLPVASSGASSTPTPGPTSLGGIAALKPDELAFAPGSALAIPILTGDLDLSAIGTVTEVRGKKIFAFGHAMFAEGNTRLPIATAYIYTVMSNLQQSFKFGSSVTPAGTLFSDEQTGIVGISGETPPTIPITVAVSNRDGAVKRTYKYQLAHHPRLTPMLLPAALLESLSAQRNVPENFTVRIAGTATFKGQDGPSTLNLTDVSSNNSFNPFSVLFPLAILTDNPYENLELTKLQLTVDIENVNRSASIKSITLDRTTAAPGDTVTATIEIEPYHATVRNISFPVKIPDDAPDGQFDLSIGSASEALTTETSNASYRFDPKNIAQLRTGIDRVLAYDNDKIYATLTLNPTGTAVDGIEKKSLPASKLARFASAKKAEEIVPILRSHTSSIDASAVIPFGGESFSLTIHKNANDRYFKPAPKNIGNSHPNRFSDFDTGARRRHSEPDFPMDDP